MEKKKKSFVQRMGELNWEGAAKAMAGDGFGERHISKPKKKKKRHRERRETERRREIIIRY